MIVLDSSTLILLAKLELLNEFVESVGDKVIIPEAVARESCSGKTLDALFIERAVREGRIAARVLKQRQLYEQIRRDFPLGKGEAEAIALAVTRKATFVGIDDKQGINACKLLKLPFTTAIGILVWLYEKRMIDQATARRKLDALALYGRYKRSIIDDARTRLEAKQ